MALEMTCVYVQVTKTSVAIEPQSPQRSGGLTLASDITVLFPFHVNHENKDLANLNDVGILTQTLNPNPSHVVCVPKLTKP